MLKLKFLLYSGFIILSGTLFLSACLFLFNQEDRIKFSHKSHERKALCSECHGNMESLNNSESSNLPKQKKCLECHEEKVSSNCSFCHTNPKKPKSYDYKITDIIFSHSSHVTKVEYGCQSCHVNTTKFKTKKEFTIGSHDVCNKCHEDDFQAMNCMKCHKDLTKYGAKPISEFAHSGNYTLEHREPAKGNEDYCIQCHQQSFCADCHSNLQENKPLLHFNEDVERNFIHQGDFVSRHGIEADADPGLCVKCHSRNSCLNCHKIRGIAQLSKGSIKPHVEADWVSRRHKRFARSNISRCASCHDEGPNSKCIECHSSGKNKPHPPGWNRSKNKNERVCKICHN